MMEWKHCDEPTWPVVGRGVHKGVFCAPRSRVGPPQPTSDRAAVASLVRTGALFSKSRIADLEQARALASALPWSDVALVRIPKAQGIGANNTYHAVPAVWAKTYPRSTPSHRA
jgi:hypothetical protein